MTTNADDAAQTLEETAPDGGRHATARPAPLPPEPAPTSPVPPPGGWANQPEEPAAATTAEEPGGWTYASPEPVQAQPAAPHGQYPPPITPEPPVDDGRLFPPPNAPRSPSAGTHVLGVIVGLILGPIAVAGVLIGQARILEAQVDHWDASFDLLGILLVTCGLVLLACVLLLGLWTAAVPITAGIVLSVLGGLALYAPGVTRTQVLDVLTTQGWHREVTQVTVAGTSGTLLVAGFLVLFGGVVVALARRHGVHLGEFRERNRA
jgi:hypothetical protein